MHIQSEDVISFISSVGLVLVISYDVMSSVPPPASAMMNRYPAYYSCISSKKLVVLLI